MYLGLDLGTSALKGMLIDAGQNVIATAGAPLTVSRPNDGWSEQDPAHWAIACETVLDALKASHPVELSAVKGIGLSGHMHGATLIDRADRVIRPCILWNDTRAHREAKELDDNPLFRQITGNIVFPGFTAPKLVWVERNEPDNFARVAKVLLPKDYLRLWLTGEHMSEMSDSAGTAWLDTGARSWSPELLDVTNMRRDQMPELVEGSQVGGTMHPALAARWGMGSNIVVAGGAGDNAASAIGMGTIAAGSAFVSLGTSGVLFAANDAYLPNAASAVHTFCHALPETWHQMGVILSATDSLNWLAGVAGVDAGALTGELGDTLLAPGNPTFLPYISGERTPHNDAAIRGAFSGLGHDSDRPALTRAVLEGVCFAFRDCLEALRIAGTEISRVTAIGGGSRSDYWLKAMATTLGLPVDVPRSGDFGAAFGAARLGLIAAENADPSDVCIAPATARTFEPEQSLSGAFDAAYQRYVKLYPAIKGATQ
ncbi:MAG: xylulokinase [Nitratireductor sp.]|nr:xylulokinase [Nitratireductor sp.]